jgi:hypothetical protein
MAMIYPGAAVNNTDNNEILTPNKAAEYLAQQWGRPFTTRDLSNFCWNNKEKLEFLGIAPMSKESTTTLWRRGTLDAIVANFAAPRLREEIYGKPAAPRRQKKSLDVPQE